MLPWWSTTHLTPMHTDYSTTSKQNTNGQLLDFDAAAWVINIPVHNMKLYFMKAPCKPRLRHFSQPSKPRAMLAEPHMSPMMTPHLMLLNQPLSSALQMPPLMGAILSLGSSIVFTKSFDALFLTLEDEEDNIKALTTFSSSPITTALHMCQPYLNTVKPSIRCPRHFILSPSHLPMLE